MGGGGAMRAAAKVAGFSVVNSGLRGTVPEHPVSAAARKATRPVSAILSSSDDVKSSVLLSSQNDSPVQRPCWELDDWEFAGAQDELFADSGDPTPRLVFGGAPTLQEAKEATAELKDTLEKVFLSAPDTARCGSSVVTGQELGLPLPSNLDYLETKACVTTETRSTPSVPKHAIQAFKFLNETPVAQTVIASIACDPKVWNAVLQNEALVDFLQSHKNSTPFADRDPNVTGSVADAYFQDNRSPKSFDESSESGESEYAGNGSTDFFQKIKFTVVEMMSSLSDYFQNLFGGSVAEKVSQDANSSAGPAFLDRALGASFLGLAVMVIMMVVLKRG